MTADPHYMDRLVEAFTDLLRREKRTSLTDGEVAQRIGRRVGRAITSQVAGRWVAGKVKPRSDLERKAFAEVLGVPAGWLYWNEGVKVGTPALARQPGTHEGIRREDVDAARARLQAKKDAEQQAVAGDRPHPKRRPKP